MSCSPNPQPWPMTPIEVLLRTRIGLDAALIGRVGIQRAVWSRMRKLGLRTLEDYRKLLQALRPEWNELVEAVVVDEDRPLARGELGKHDVDAL